MIRAAGEVTEIWLSAVGTVGGCIRCLPVIQVVPGQYLRAFAPELPGSLPVTLFVSDQNGSDMVVAPPLPDTWRAGTRLVVTGAYGKSFRLPLKACRVALAALEDAPYRLLPIIHKALAQQAMVTLFTRHLPEHLPVAVEVLPLDALPEAVGWADFLALDVRLDEISTLSDRLKQPAGQIFPCPAQVLVRTAMPCGGVAECSVCAVQTRRGWALACKDGPVFDFNILVTR